MQRLLLFCALGLLATAAAGCVSGSDSCQSDQDCGRYLVCEGGFCVRGCDEHQDCARGFFCDEGHCR